MAEQPAEWQRVKREIRTRALASRQAQGNQEGLSRQICRKLAALPEYVAAGTVMFYVDVRSEVRTRPLMSIAWEQGKRIVVPYCEDRRLGLFALRNLDELAAGTLGILEPRVELRSRSDRQVDVSELDFIVVPGVAFDRHGGRLGHGAGYYDKLLSQVPARTMLVALAFECQLFPEIPMLPHDVFMHKIITEKAVYEATNAART